MDQQATPPQQIQQQNKKGVFIDYETLKEAKYSVADNFVLAFLIFIISVLGVIAINDIVAQVAFILILILSVIVMVDAFSGFNKLDKFTPKVKKIVKEIIYYEDGQTEEKEYEC